ncbi:MAG: molybdate ABC transporter permease subunit [Prevotella sp.]|nr:molybdate ABC transporter permease subunit [Prevotella sp.]
MDSDFLQTLWLTGKLATLTTTILLLLGLPIAYILAYKHFRFKSIVESLISMPMVLPPTVLGFYVLVAYSPQNAFGKFLETTLHLRLAFSFEGILVASIIFSLPFMVQPLINGFELIPKSYCEAAYTLGKSPFTTFMKILIPNIRSSILTGVAMTFAHCIGEFGLVIMVGGNMPGETRVASVAIYDAVQLMDYTTANKYALILFLISLAILSLIYGFNGKKKKDVRN